MKKLTSAPAAMLASVVGLGYMTFVGTLLLHLT